MKVLLRQLVGVALGWVLLVQGGRVHAQQAGSDGWGSSRVLTGAATFGLAYGAAVLVAATSNHPGDNRLYVPLLGPWLDLSDRGRCAVTMPSCDHETTNKILIVSDGLIQAIGAATILSGFLAPDRRTASQGFSVVQLIPMTFGRGRPGLAAYGIF
jgi:hypothetical protein